MLLALFSALSFSESCVISAVHKDGTTSEFARVEWTAKGKGRPDIIPLTTETFEKGAIKRFIVRRPDGAIIGTNAPASTTSVSFRLTLVGETPVAVTATAAYRRQKHQISIDRAKGMPLPVYHSVSAEPAEQDTGILAMMRRYWYIPVALGVINMFMNAKKAQAAQ